MLQQLAEPFSGVLTEMSYRHRSAAYCGDKLTFSLVVNPVPEEPGEGQRDAVMRVAITVTRGAELITEGDAVLHFSDFASALRLAEACRRAQ
jgi:hypothetical protein